MVLFASVCGVGRSGVSMQKANCGRKKNKVRKIPTEGRGSGSGKRTGITRGVTLCEVGDTARRRQRLLFGRARGPCTGGPEVKQEGATMRERLRRRKEDCGDIVSRRLQLLPDSLQESCPSSPSPPVCSFFFLDVNFSEIPRKRRLLPEYSLLVFF